jgi:hypothetical protein
MESISLIKADDYVVTILAPLVDRSELELKLQQVCVSQISCIKKGNMISIQHTGEQDTILKELGL